MGNKILAFSDLHIRDHGSFAPFNAIEPNGLTRELNNIINGMKWVAEQIILEEPICVALLGDVYHTPEGVSTTTIFGSSIALGHIKDACAKVGAELIIIPGNHDAQNVQLSITSISTLGGFGTIINSNTIHKIQCDGKWYRLGICQFNVDDEAYKILKSLETKCDIMLTHLDFQYGMYENGFKSESSIPNEYKVRVISGDLHAASEIGTVIYPGSLVQNRFTRRDLKYVGGVVVYDLDEHRYERRPNTASYHYVKIESPKDWKDLQADLETFKVVLQVKCEMGTSVFGDHPFVYIPVNKAESADSKERTKNEGFKLKLDSPVSMLKKYVSEHNPSAARIIDEVIGGQDA